VSPSPMPKKPTALSVSIRDCRGALHLTQAEFAEWTGFSTATIVRWENGMRSPPRAAQRLLLVHQVATKRPDLAAPLAAAMDVPFLPPPTSAQSPFSSHGAIDERDLRVSLYRAAEELQVPSARLRAVLADLVGEWGAARWETAAIAKALRADAEGPASRGKPTRG
jgi:transcriptional regulator with XRE-family HTH domain